MDSIVDLIKFVRDCGLDTSGYVERGGNLILRCPMAKAGKHRHTVDRKPSLALKVSEKGFQYNCFACGFRGSSLFRFIDTLKEEKLLGENADDMMLKHAISVKFPDFYKEEQTKNAQYMEYGVLSKFSRSSFVFDKYNMKKRGLSRRTIRKARLCYDAKRRTIIMPSYSFTNELLGWVEHPIGKKYYNNFDTRQSLYLEWLSDAPSAILVEGMYDALKIYQHLDDLDLLDKFAVLGMYGTEVATEQVNRIVENYNQVLLMFDNDMAGINGEKNLHRMIKYRLPAVWHIDYEGHDPDCINSRKDFLNYLQKPRMFGCMV